MTYRQRAVVTEEPQLSRRRVLSGIGVATALGLAGCASPRSDAPTPMLTVRVTNQSERTQSVTTLVVDEDETQVHGETSTVPEGVSSAVTVEGDPDNEYTIRVDGARWATSGYWTPAACREYTFTTTLDSFDGTPSVTAESACSTDG